MRLDAGVRIESLLDYKGTGVIVSTGQDLAGGPRSGGVYGPILVVPPRRF